VPQLKKKNRRAITSTPPLGPSGPVYGEFYLYLSKANDCSNPFTSDEEMAGVDWLREFLQIHPDMSLRKKMMTAAACAMGFGKVDV